MPTALMPSRYMYVLHALANNDGVEIRTKYASRGSAVHRLWSSQAPGAGLLHLHIEVAMVLFRIPIVHTK